MRAKPHCRRRHTLLAFERPPNSCWTDISNLLQLEKQQASTSSRLSSSSSASQQENKMADTSRRRRVSQIYHKPAILFILFSLLLIQPQAPVAHANPLTSPTQTNNGLPAGVNDSIAHEIVRHPTTTLTTADNQRQQHPSQSAIPFAVARKNFVKLGDNTSSNIRTLNYANSQYSSNRHNNNNNRFNNQSISDLSGSKLGDSQQNQQNKRNLIENVCIGTSNRLSSQSNKADHYQILADRYRNCTYVIGNLEITWLEKSADNKPVDLTFLESIREITGYLLIAYVEVEKIRMPNLQIIRGRDLFKVNNGPKEEFAMFLIDNELKTLELPNLREILVGSIGSYNNRNLCHLRTINWDEILDMGRYRPVFFYNGTQPECAPCDDSCLGSCWGEGPEMCQKFSKTNCSPQCSQGRCFGPLPRECCHLFCAGGCTGPKQTDCFACKNFNDDGECIQECPSMMRYNPSKFLWEPNPSGKYTFGANCVKECPDHLLRDNGACVRNCPPNKRPINGECISCSGPCEKNCTMEAGREVVHSGNIDDLVNCSVIDGSIAILDTSFSGYSDIYPNNTIGPKWPPMHPSRLEAFKTLREITGFLNIQANHSDFKNLSSFRNLETIGGRTKTDMSEALSIIKTSLVSLNLRSLKKVVSGRVRIEANKDLCFVDTIKWSHSSISSREAINARNNADNAECRQLGLKCHEQCTQDGCWGPGPDECLSCNNYKFDDYCLDNCTTSQSLGFLSYDAGKRTCKRCHSECKGGCSGSEAHHCWKCKNLKDGPHCVAECPSHKYSNNGICEECDRSCVNGCTGPSNKLGEGGCNSCGKAMINYNDSNMTIHCSRPDEPCPEGYYREYVGPQAEGLLKSLSGKPVCRRCHQRCKSCTGMGAHVSVCECAKYVAGEQCEDYCPRDYFADERSRRCIKCSPECNGCFGPTEANCITCRVYRIYYGSYSPIASAQVTASARVQSLDTNAKQQQAKFNCTAQCPPDKPHRISESNMLDPYCSEDPGLDPENPRIVSLGSAPFLFVIIISASLMFCFSVYRCQIEKDKTVKLTMHLSGIDDVEPLNPSNMKPNLAPLRSIKETELRKGNILGSGFGGTVYQGFWFPGGQESHKKPRPVAIKVLRDNGQTNMHKEFLDEAYIMASANHPNLVRLLAVCMTPNHLMLVTQLMPLGCLLEYVKKHKDDIGSKNLLEWCKQIAKGMAYLEDQRMVHRDLALRNVLLQTSGRALISDFGLAKLLELDQSEYHSGGGRLPIKWLAPECIRERKFTHKSDVWAFGVTIWELLNFGERPFEEYDTKDVPMAIEKGARLQQPLHMSAEVYKVMFACWFYNPDDRPNFSSLAQNFVNFARDPERYLICRTKGIEYNNMRREPGGYKNSDTDENEEGSDENSSTGEESQPMSAMSDLTPSAHNRTNEVFNYELRHHHSESEASQHLPTPTLKKVAHVGPFHTNGQQMIEEDVFCETSHRHSLAMVNKMADANNNNFIPTRLNNNGDSCWTVHQTVSTTSLGQKSEQPTDVDDYLIPSPPYSNEDKFSKFLASHEGPSSKMPPAPNYSRDPPHSAGLIGISNDEYFLTRIHYVNSNGSHAATNASSGHIPQSLV